MNINANTNCNKEDLDLRKKYLQQFFIYHDYINDRDSSSTNNKSIDFEKFLTITKYSEDKDVCFQRMKVHYAVCQASSVNVTRVNVSSDSSPASSQIHQTLTSFPISSSSISNLTDTNINSQSPLTDITYTVHPGPVSQSTLNSRDRSVAIASSSSFMTSFPSSSSSRSIVSTTSGTSTSASLHSSVSSSSRSSSVHINALARVRSKSAGGRRSIGRRDVEPTDEVFIPDPSLVNQQDVAFFAMKIIEKPCDWPSEYQVSSEVLKTFKNMIAQKVEVACKYTFDVAPQLQTAAAAADEAARQRFYFQGSPIAATIGWSSYQMYCGIADCTCEKDFGIPHFLYDATAIPRNIPYSVLVDKDTNNEETKNVRETLYHQMKRENAVGRKIWQNSRNRVSD